MSKINRKVFYERYRVKYGGLKQIQVNTYEAIFNFWDSRSVLVDKRWLAYILATAFHETGRAMKPIREGFCSSDACSIRVVTRMYKQGKISRNYALVHRNGYSYFGRGLVQLTHDYNYKRIGKSLGLETKLYDNPSLALKVDMSVKILCIGMLIGSFVSKHNLERYFNEINEDWTGARRIINGTDKKELIKGYALNFLSFIEMLEEKEVLRKSINPQMPTMEVEDSNQMNIYFEVDRKLESTNDEDYKHILLKPGEKENVLSYDEFLEKDVKVKK
ncbi:MAG: FIG00986091: hypothetical protein [uncultured Sulfurovum sp.]|uniref:Glycoside hydrolase family 19 catalytic domain-containing protein n=1 Tax=uncultured Sulfurovum sp. TaxID=269237 RepID=A0A6S6SDF0_9BACT|nr:MAG: FIG00986091: hypothetical protein [uncultured Sulfurovum sp.]